MHLPKLFNNIADLTFEQVDETRVSNLALSMISGEGERVQFNKPCLCAGAVEDWLNGLVDSMRATLCAAIGDAVVAYEDKPRHQWVLDHPAQVGR